MLRKLDAALGRMGNRLSSTAWLLLRVLGSAMFMTHGFAKLFGENPQPFRSSGMTSINIGELVAWPIPFELNALFIAGVIEFFGGALLILGLWTHLVALLAVLLMIMAYLIAHLAWFPTLNGGELAAMYFLLYLAIFSFGPGQFSVDALLELRRQQKRQKKMDAM
ncbi:MAG: DoxX family protein [Gammaproteobacteria bacterium]